MSRTVRRKGWHVVISNKWRKQDNNLFAYIKRCWKNNPGIDERIAENEDQPQRSAEHAEMRHRDSFWKTYRSSRYVAKVPRSAHKLSIHNHLVNDTDYEFDEKAKRKSNMGIASILWD